jgi:autotransporter passenger strand-loop-strand repeat protein
VTVSSGGYQTVFSAGVASGTVVSGGGEEIVSSGGTAVGATISGGIVELTSGAVAPAAIIFAGGGTLQLDNSQHFSGTVAGFGLPDQIDLVDIAFGAGTTPTFNEAVSNLSGTLIVSSGSEVANITLLGRYVPSQFDIAADGRGGTLVTDPPAQTGASGDAGTTGSIDAEGIATSSLMIINDSSNYATINESGDTITASGSSVDACRLRRAVMTTPSTVIPAPIRLAFLVCTIR